MFNIFKTKNKKNNENNGKKKGDEVLKSHVVKAPWLRGMKKQSDRMIKKLNKFSCSD